MEQAVQNETKVEVQEEAKAEPKTEKKARKPSTRMWHVVLGSQKHSFPENIKILSAKDKRELRAMIENHVDYEPLSFVRGTSYQFKIQRSFEILKETAQLEF